MLSQELEEMIHVLENAGCKVDRPVVNESPVTNPVIDAWYWYATDDGNPKKFQYVGSPTDLYYLHAFGLFETAAGARNRVEQQKRGEWRAIHIPTLRDHLSDIVMMHSDSMSDWAINSISTFVDRFYPPLPHA
jgi:hypothetical protein